jgi:hypothetical protein
MKKFPSRKHITRVMSPKKINVSKMTSSSFCRLELEVEVEVTFRNQPRSCVFHFECGVICSSRMVPVNEILAKKDPKILHVEKS